jgi:hypothetical protein
MKKHTPYRRIIRRQNAMGIKYAIKLEYAISVGSGRNVIYAIKVPVDYEAYDSLEEAKEAILICGLRYETRLINLLFNNGKETCFIALYDKLNDCLVDRVHWGEHLKYKSVITKKRAAGKNTCDAADYEPNALALSDVFRLHTIDKNTNAVKLKQVSSYIVPYLVSDDNSQTVKGYASESNFDYYVELVELYEQLTKDNAAVLNRTTITVA